MEDKIKKAIAYYDNGDPIKDADVDEIDLVECIKSQQSDMKEMVKAINGVVTWLENYDLPFNPEDEWMNG